jgi:hypothetical protein
MAPWIIAGLALLVALGIGAARRHRARHHASIREDLFEGLLPSAVTGSIEHPRESDGWELRWADVTNLTASDVAMRPRPRITAARAADAASSAPGAPDAAGSTDAADTADVVAPSVP